MHLKREWEINIFCVLTFNFPVWKVLLLGPRFLGIPTDVSDKCFPVELRNWFAVRDWHLVSWFFVGRILLDCRSSCGKGCGAGHFQAVLAQKCAQCHRQCGYLGSVIPKVSFCVCMNHVRFFWAVLSLDCLLMPSQRKRWPCNPTWNPSSLWQEFHPSVVLQGELEKAPSTWSVTLSCGEGREQNSSLPPWAITLHPEAQDVITPRLAWKCWFWPLNYSVPS